MTIKSAITRLDKLMGEHFSTSEAILSQHGQNESYFEEVLPDGVAFPGSTKDVSQIVKICAEEDCPIVPWGTGTSLEGHALAFQGGISLDMSRMNKVLEVHDEDLDAVVQPGVTREALNVELRDKGMFFPVDPGANASLGGMAATRASGTTAVRYGTMRENVMALEAVMADGSVIRTGTRARKSSAGYDLTKLLIGSEGTLGIITELTVRLQGQPEAISAATCAFETLEDAVNTVIQTIQMGIPMARIEFVDEVSIMGLNRHFKSDMPEKPHLFMEFHGSEAGVAEQSEMVGEIANDNGGSAFEWSAKTEDRSRLWYMRHNAFYAQKALKPGCNVVTTDICVPLSQLAKAVTDTRADLDASSLLAPMLGHVGDGNYHAAILLDPNKPEELSEARELANRMAMRALELGGTVTGEHGIGRGKMKFMLKEHGEAVGVMKTLKRALDPQNILNPGKILDLN